MNQIILFITFIIFIFLFNKIKNVKNKENMKEIKELEFIHIPKNAGTSIENLGKKFNINWGRFVSSSDYPLSDTPCNYFYWHSPHFIRNKNYKYFAILRNPYDKIISEFYYNEEQKNKDKSDIEIFYLWLNHKYNLIKKNKYWNHCHILPQSEFIYDKSGMKKVDHLIYMDENFINNLDNLFKKYNLGIDINQLKKDNSRKRTFSKLDLNEQAIKQINEMYDEDFKRFNFTKLQYGVENFINQHDLDYYEDFNSTHYFLGLITRCKDEFFIKEFCDYYITQGIDKIYIIDDNSKDKNIYNNIDPQKVNIIYDKVKTKAHNAECKPGCLCNRRIASKIYSKVKKNFKWMIYVDVDEFVTTKKNINKTIKQELMDTFKDVDYIKIPWVMMACNKRLKNPKSVLRENIIRMNHNLKHPDPYNRLKFACRYESIPTKSIFKTEKFNDISDHIPLLPINKNLNNVDGVYNKKSELNFNYKNLREKDIKNGYLLCYHYRIISVENSMNKLKNNSWYIQYKFDIDNLMSSDYPEIKDETLKNKSTYSKNN